MPSEAALIDVMQVPEPHRYRQSTQKPNSIVAAVLSLQLDKCLAVGVVTVTRCSVVFEMPSARGMSTERTICTLK